MSKNIVTEKWNKEKCYTLSSFLYYELFIAAVCMLNNCYFMGGECLNNNNFSELSPFLYIFVSLTKQMFETMLIDAKNTIHSNVTWVLSE
jgi:hypothetical protein